MTIRVKVLNSGGVVDVVDVTDNAFCPTGKGGGVDPTCGKGGKTSKTTNVLSSRTVGVPKNQTDQWKQEIERSTRFLTSDSLKLITRNTKEIKVASTSDLKKTPGTLKNPEQTIAFYSPKRKTLVVTQEAITNQKTLSHELAHAIDRRDLMSLGMFSNTSDFKMVWNSEIKHPSSPIGKYAQTHPKEGFAEAVGFIHKHGITVSEKKIPKTLAYLRKNKIIK